MFVRDFPQGLAHSGDSLIEIVLLDDGVGPHRGYQGVLVDYLIRVLHQLMQHIKGAGI